MKTFAFLRESIIRDFQEDEQTLHGLRKVQRICIRKIENK